MRTENWKPSPVSSLYRYIVGLHDKIYLYKDALISSTFLTMMAALLKFMFIYYQFIMLDDTSVRKCVCVLAATLTRSKINWEFVYLCIRSKDFAPISTISDYIHWAALAVWFFVIFITAMKSWMFEDLLHTYFVLFDILPWNTTPNSIKDLILSWMYLCIVYIAVCWITITLHQSNQTRSTTWWILQICKYTSYLIPFCNLQYIYM
jgi:hypothetical protein